MLSAHAASIILDTHYSSGNTYRYTYAAFGGQTFTTGSQFILSGLAGVTSAIADPTSSYGYYARFFDATNTNTSATFTVNQNFMFPDSGGYFDLFVISSTSSTVGTALYSVPTTPTATTGSLQGPVSAATAVTPEPSSLVLMGTGLLAALSSLRRRFV